MTLLSTDKVFSTATLSYVSGEGLYLKYPGASKEYCCNCRSDGSFDVTEDNQRYWCALPAGHMGLHTAYTTGKVEEKLALKRWDMGGLLVNTPKCILCTKNLCDICGLCHTDTCTLKGKSARTHGDLLVLRHIMAKSQKVRGYVALAQASIPVPSPYKVVTEMRDLEACLESMLNGTKTGIFVRPCPVRPRHGFVESRLIPTGTTSNVLPTLKGIYQEALNADPEAELLLSPAIDATHNMIITPTRMAIGPSNDGATAGKSSISVPLMGVPFPEITADVLQRSGIDALKEDPYIEVVAVCGAASNFVAGKYAQVLFTQLRAGVKIPPKMGDDYIPHTLTVRKVIEASGDLLEWERQTQTMSANPEDGEVVLHLGGTLISHYGVHCMFNSIPCITSRRPAIGDQLIPTLLLDRPDPRAVIDGLTVGARFPLEQNLDTHKEGTISCNQAALVVMYALHNAGVMAGRDGFWLGVGTAFMMRLGMAASHGEARHADSVRRSLRREYIYKLALNDFFTARATLGVAQELFQHYSWQSGYGGKKWETCTESVFKMDGAARALLSTPTDQAVTNLVAALNTAVNQAHNGGWWLNKFISCGAFEKSAQQSLYSLASAAPGLYNIVCTGRNGVEGIAEKWRMADPIQIPSNAVSTTNVDNPPTEGEISLKAVVKMLGIATDTVDTPQETVVPPALFLGPKIAGAPLKVSKATVYNMASIGPNTNMNELVPVPADVSITVAHGHINGQAMHVQVRIAGQLGYYSFNTLIPKPMGSIIQTNPSFSGGATKYLPLIVGEETKPGYFSLSHSYFGSVMINLPKIVGKG